MIFISLKDYCRIFSKLIDLENKFFIIYVYFIKLLIQNLMVKLNYLILFIYD